MQQPGMIQGQYPPQQYPPQQYPPQQYPPQQYPPQQYPPQQGFVQPGYAQPGYAQPGFVQPGFVQPQVVQQVIVVQAPVVKKKGFDRLVDRDGIFIKQKLDLMEVLSGCEQNSKFQVFPLGKDGDKRGKPLYKATEKSSLMSKCCLTPDCRPFEMKVRLEDDSEELDNEPFLHIDRPCKCTFYCCNRPEIKVTWVEDGKNEYIGKVVDPWTCCNVCLDVYDQNNNKKWCIEASCLQLGFHFNAPCDACQTIDFDIKTPSGEVVSTLQKRSPGCGAAMISNADNFVLNFPKGATKEDKALLMCAVLFADFRFFENKQKQGKNHGAYA